MSNEIASLVLAVDSRPVTAATGALDKFAAAGKTAANSFANLEKAASKGGGAISQAGQLARHEMINLSRQISDVGVSLASGQSPFLVLAQQGTQVADIFGSSKTGTVGGALRQVVNYVGPTRLLALGLAGVAAAGAVAINSVAQNAKALDDLARSVDTTTSKLRGLQQAAAIKGIAPEEFSKSIQQFGGAVYDAQRGMGELAVVFRANNATAKDFTGYLEKSADLIKNASSDQQRLQLLQQMGLPATMQWVRFLSQGKDGIRAAIAEAVKFDETAEGKLIAKARQFDEAWNKAANNVGHGFRSMVLDASGWLDTLSSKGTALLMKLPGVGQNVPSNILRNAMNDRAAGYDVGSRLNASSDVSGFYHGLGTGAPGNIDSLTKDKNQILHEIQLQQPSLGLFGQTPTAKEVSQTKPTKDTSRDSDHLRRAA